MSQRSGARRVRAEGSFAAGLEFELDCIDNELAGLRRLEWRRTRDGLAKLGFDVARYTEPRYPRPVESHQRARVVDRSDIVQIEAAQRGHLVRRGIGKVIGVR